LVAFDIEQLAITAGERVAFTVAIVRCGSGAFDGPPEEGGFLFRLTIGLRKSMATGVSRTSITPCRRQTSVARPTFSAVKPLPVLAALFGRELFSDRPLCGQSRHFDRAPLTSGLTRSPLPR
jgi:hypothetical protein